MACSTRDMGYASYNLGSDFNLRLWFYMFDTVGEQTLYGKYNVDPATGDMQTQLRIYTIGTRLYVDMNDAASPGDPGNTDTTQYQNSVYVQSGWNYLVVSFNVRGGLFFGSKRMDSDIFVINEGSCGTVRSANTNNIMNREYYDDDTYFMCIGNELKNTNTGAGTEFSGTSPFSGYIKSVAGYTGDISSAATFAADYQCSGCTGNCTMCDSTGVCPISRRDPEFLIYDFKEGSDLGASTWIGTQTADHGTGPSFTLAQDWFVNSPYYVDNQGFYFDNSPTCSASGFSYGSTTTGFSLGVWFKYSSAGSLVTLKTGAGANYVDLRATGSGFTVTLGALSTTLSCTYSSNTWYYVVLTMSVQTKTAQNICITIGTCSSCSQVAARFVDPGNMQICLGQNSFRGTIKSIHFYDYPISNQEATHTYATTCVPFNGVNCNYCDKTTAECYSNCANNQYGNSCDPCDLNCTSCFNAKNYECYSCGLDTTTVVPYKQFVYAQTLCPYCGDSYVYYSTPYLEECDDGNILGGDGCSKTCQIEQLYTCTPSLTDTVGPSVCSFSCTDSTNVRFQVTPFIIKAKDCDDGNMITDDGCTSLCNQNTGWTCANGTATKADDCYEICGDGYDYFKYPCDDGNTIDGDGCDSKCQIESPDYTCKYGDLPLPDICTTKCTIRTSDYGDQPCIDSNGSPLDGCNPNCEVEQGWECTRGSPYGIGIDEDIQYLKQINVWKFVEILGIMTNMNVMMEMLTILFKDIMMDGGYDCRYSDWFSRDACNEICGDGLNYGVQGQWNYLNNNECDDGNQRPGDGCDPTCRIERGWTCSGGNTGVEDVCTHECGDWRKFYHEHCDDGNDINGDGCSSGCIEEAGFRCTGGEHHWRDTCVELCGDGRNSGYFNCDDGNTVSGDGCSSTCTLESGYQCIGGNSTTADACREVCGDGINLESVECDDGNLLNTDGCNDLCEVEEGYYCVHAVKGRDKCYEVCGDGIMLGSFSCDDGDLINDDGCDDKCRIEECWECDGLSPTTCWIDPINTIGITNATMADDQSNVTIYFNNSVILQAGFDIHKAISVEVTGPLAPYNFSWYLKDADFIFNKVQTKEFSIMIDYLDTQLLGNYQENLTVCLKNVSQIKHFFCNKYLQTLPCWTFPLYFSKLAPQSYCQSAGVGTYGLYIVGGQLAFGMIFSLLGYSAGGAWDAFYLLQQTHLIPVASIAAPSCGIYFYQEFKWTNMEEDSIATWMRHAMCNDGNVTEMRPPTSNFVQNGYEYNNIGYNLADMLTIAMFALAVIPAISVIKLLLPNAVVIDNMDRFIKGRYLIAIINITYLKVAFLTMLNFTFFDTTTPSKAFNSYASIVMLLYITIVPLYYLAETVYFYKELKSLKKALDYQSVFTGEQNKENKQVIEDQVKIIRNNYRNQVLFEEYKIDNYYQYGFMVMFCIKRMVIALVLAKLHTNVDYQLFFLSTMAAVTMTYIAAIQPYKYPYRNGVAILNEAGVFYITTASMVWARADLFCAMNFRGFVTPMAYTFTAFLGFQALIWLICQFAFLSTKNGATAPVAVEPEIVPKEIAIRSQFKNLHEQVEEERKRQKEERINEMKKELKDKNKTEEQKQKEAQEKANKADDDQIVGLPQPTEGDDAAIKKQPSNANQSEEEKSESLMSQTVTTKKNETTQQQSDDISEIDASEKNQSKSRNNQTSYEDEDDSRDLSRESEYDEEESYESEQPKKKAKR